ncbi:DUF1972 domain-containing protein [Sphingomonas sp. Leaf25]|uniref:DUF1972 domain-containing protein n=1 Tax=Sphingomonas sp. Leaf25 TaxID=1735692 RepID=UPI0007019BF8|nr:DUF1972 domain-containing protein [Sphingomonas sp. Leaf25]KQN07215.1 glycosyl transferase [Sphingomonas sp. Leaf25]
MRQLVVLGVRGIPAAHGGFETFVEVLALYLVGIGWDVLVYCQGSERDTRFEDEWNGIRRVHIPVTAKGPIGTIEFDIKATADALRRPGVLLTLGYNTGFLCFKTAAFRRRNLVNMDGLEWKRAKYRWAHRIYLWINERLAAMAATRLIADHPAIADHLARHTSRRRITTIPYGAESIETADPALLAPFDVEPDRYFTLIARPEPENSVLEIVRGFSARPRGYRLILLGTYCRSNAYQAAVLDAAGSEVVFAGAIYDKAILRALRFHCFAYLHGHRVGGTNPSLVEALGAGNAVIAHDNRFNRWVCGDAGRFFATAEECDAAIEALIAAPAQRSAMRSAARARWQADFTWDSVLAQYAALLAEFAERAVKR